MEQVGEETASGVRDTPRCSLFSVPLLSFTLPFCSVYRAERIFAGSDVGCACGS